MTIGVCRGLCRASILLAAVIVPLASAQADQSVLATIRARGFVTCGVGAGPKGYSAINAQGAWSGINVDFCRALAAAVLGSKDAVKFQALSGEEAVPALRAGKVDVLSRNIGMTSSLDTSLGVRFAGILVYDGQGFMVRKSQNITSALELSGARICIAADGTTEQGITDYFGGLKMPFELVKFDGWSNAVMAYASKGCQVLSAEVSALALARQGLADANDHSILKELASKQAVGPVVRQGDEEWFSVVRWTLYALIAAEELGITGANVDAVRTSGSGQARRFLGIGMDLGKHLGRQLGLSADWTQRVIKQVGNYGELFERHLGQKSPLKLDRRLNNLASKGGLHYAPSFQ
jgi:general L-amino acid transport system substrate-binding protein